MKALTIKQPWCAAIAYGTKRVENRSWPVPHAMIGATIALHAGKSPDIAARPPLGEAWPVDHRMTLGGIIATARIADCHSAVTTCGPDGMGPCSPWGAWQQWHWVLTDVRPLTTPVPCKGALGLWTVPPDAESAIVAQLKAQDRIVAATIANMPAREAMVREAFAPLLKEDDQ